MTDGTQPAESDGPTMIEGGAESGPAAGGDEPLAEDFLIVHGVILNPGKDCRPLIEHVLGTRIPSAPESGNTGA